MSPGRGVLTRLTVAAVIVAHVSACATRPANIRPKYVSPLIYAQATCAELVGESTTIAARLDPLGTRINKNANIDAIWVGTYVPLLILLPFTFFLLHGDGVQYEEYSSLLGQRDAVQQQAHQKRCDRMVGSGSELLRSPPGDPPVPVLKDSGQDSDDSDDPEYASAPLPRGRGAIPLARR